MKDLIFITAYCPTEKQERLLERCVDSVLKCGFHVAVISHSHIPIHIQKKCNFYLYDYNNEVSEDYDLLGHVTYFFEDRKLLSRLFNKIFYGFAIYRMFSMVSQIAINFGYENIHHIEYDCELIDPNLINENSILLKTYDSIIYTDSGNENGFLFGSFKSFKVSSLPEKFKNYDREFIESEMKKIHPTHLETFTRNLFKNSGKVLFQSEPSDEKFKRGNTEHHRNLHFTIYYDEKNNSLNFFYKCILNEPEEIMIITNKKNVINLIVKPHHWHTSIVGQLNEINHIRIDNSKKVIYEKNIDDKFREILKIKSYILDNEK
jgi:hypothetical protein